MFTLTDTATMGRAMYDMAERLYPICRSITGDGVRETLAVVGEALPLTIYEVPSGTSALDWTIPNEWNIRDAYIKNAKGERVVDFRKSTLHVVNYSVPIRRRMSLAELRPHLHSIEEHPDWIPYRTSYYNEGWGFCLPHRQLQNLTDDEYEVCIDSSLEPGSLTYAECVIPGTSAEEILFYTHVCHPSLANDNLSGIAVLTQLGTLLQNASHRYSYRLVFGPGTIGSITWLSRNEKLLSRIAHGLVVGLVGDAGPVCYKRSRRGDAEIDQAAAVSLRDSSLPSEMIDFSPYGYDERQFCSAGINLPMGRMTRSPNGSYPQYHTSADDLSFISPVCLAESLSLLYYTLGILESNYYYENLSPKGEPQLGKRGLYSKTGGGKGIKGREFAMLWVLNQSDGSQSLLNIAQRSGLPYGSIAEAARDLETAGLLRKLGQGIRRKT
jgi:aminopeptidase-like protein